MSDIGSSYRTRHWALVAPVEDFRYQLHCRAFAIACAFRLTLPDALTDASLPYSAIHWLGAILLAINGSVLGWGLVLTGSAGSLIFAWDQLSQSGYLLFCAIAALSCFAGSKAGRRARLTSDFPRAVRLLTAGVYSFAVMHKLNRGYFDPNVSCANAGLDVLAEGAAFQFPSGLVHSFASPLWPVAHLVIEAAIPLLLFLRSRVGVLLATLMHAPLTVIFAPSFAFVMMSGWVYFFQSGELREFLSLARRRAAAWTAMAVVLALSSRALLFEGRWSEDPEWCVKEALFWCVFAAIWVCVPSLASAKPTALARVRPGVRTVVLLVFFAFNALTPYLGLQFHHTTAMLSNLRIDRGCFNSLVFPEWLRGPDPYVRLDRLDFEPGRASASAAPAFLERLWEPSALFEARKEWCRIQKAPLRVSGSYGERPFDVANFCAEGGWPLDTPALPGFRRFQTNLTKQCDRRCLH